MSILTYLRRLTPINDRVSQLMIVWTVAFQSFFTVLALLFAFFSCRNPAARWSLIVHITDFRCLDCGKVVLGLSIVFSALDFWTLALPMRIIWRFRLNKWLQLAAFLVFVMGGFAIAAACVRLIYVHGAYDSWDSSWNSVGLVEWDQLEVSFGFMTANLPVFSVLLTEYLPRWYYESFVPTPLGQRYARWRERRNLNRLGSNSSTSAPGYIPPPPKLRPDVDYDFDKKTATEAKVSVDAPRLAPRSSVRPGGADFLTGHAFFSDDDSKKEHPRRDKRETKLPKKSLRAGYEQPQKPQPRQSSQLPGRAASAMSQRASTDRDGLRRAIIDRSTVAKSWNTGQSLKPQRLYTSQAGKALTERRLDDISGTETESETKSTASGGTNKTDASFLLIQKP
jgi:hypothetical protein